MFFNTAFDVMLSVILAICAALLLSGRGDFILTKLRSRADRDKPLSYDKKKFSITMGLLCVAMLVAEIIMIFFSETSLVAVVIAMLIVLIAFIAGIVYLRKYAKVEVEEKKEKTLRDRINELERKSR